MSAAVIMKAPYAKGSATSGNAKYIATRPGVDKSINNRICINARYIATRPKVEKLGTHGLFSSQDNVSLTAVMKGLEEYKGNVWMPIISLRREDADRLGYNNAKTWQTLLKSKQADIAKNFKIPLKDLQWYAAFHDKDDHPHIHMLVYSKSGGGYLSKEGIRVMRSELTRTIFKDELYHLYDYKTQTREKLTEKSKEKISETAKRIGKNISVSNEFQKLFGELSVSLKHTTGKKNYGYLKKEQKQVINKLFQELAQDKSIADIYDEWCSIQARIMGYYQDGEVEFPPLWENEVFHKVRNIIIDKADRLDNIENKSLVQNAFVDLVLKIFKILHRDCEQEIAMEKGRHIDKKEWQKIMEKKEAMGMKMGGV
ncbi:MAG: hypothetical protein BWY15_02160 [Firmicutes bacterium ADurb.Bin193]|nr:MAG: hypothetical protein BWY15_02160 [Firmicutes bacterium ADurb.Bin193]